MKQTKLNIISALLFVAAMAIETSAWAQDFSIEATYNSSTHKTLFTIERSGSSLPQQTIKYRTVNLSAYAGIHYTAVSDTYTFPENITTLQVEVSEYDQYTTSYAYHYQTDTTRSYRFEVLDVNGFELAHNDRSMTTGAQFSTTYLNNGVTDLVYFNDNGQIQSGSGNKYLDVSYSSSNWTQVTDAGYSQGVHTVSTNSLYNSNSNLRTILNALSYKMYATVYFTQKEEHDGYQYIQIYTGNAGTYDKVDDPNGGIGTLTNSLYRACFILSYSPSGSVMSDPHYQFFPHRYNYVDKAAEIAANITHYEFDYNNSHLYEQKFINSSYNSSTSGSLVLLPTAENINIRFDAGGGGNDHDEWDFKNLKVRLALVDETYPTPINIAGITVSAGPYVKGNTFYISVPFSEIVNTANYSGYKKLVTSWGDATYCSGDGTNVITFKGTINANAGTTLAITSLQCNFKDLTGTFFQGLGNSGYTDSFDKTFNGVTCTESYTLAATNTEFTGLQSEYVVSNTAIEPHPTVYFYKGKKETANKVQLTENTNYTLSWANNNAAGTGSVTATGINSYTGSASTTFPIRWSTYTVSFYGNGSIGIPVTGTMSDQAFQYGVAQSLSANAFSREGFTFAGWNTQPDGSGASYSDGEAVTGLTSEDGAVIDLYAQWTVIPEVTVSNSDQTVCLGDSIEDMIITATNGTITSVTGLPAGVEWSGTTISGTPTVSGTFNVTVTVSSDQTPDCGEETATATITVNPLPEVTVTNNVQTICMDNQIQEMEIIYSNGTIESVTGLPENVNWSDTPSGATIFGAPAEYGTFNATVTVTSDQGCGTATADVTITVKPNPEVTVSNNFQTVCENSAITAMEITATHATIENVTGLPTGVSWSKDSSGATGTISGTPTASGTYNVTVTVNSDQTPSCGIAYAYVRITVNPLPEVTVTNDNQTVCAGDAIVAMEITATNATIANVEGLPAGVTWSGTMISGTPTESGTFNVTVMVDSYYGCGIGMAELTIIVNPLPEAYTLDITGYGDSDGGWNLIASPLAESIAATEVGNLVAETASDFDLYRFNQAANMEWENWKQEESEHYHFNLESGQGYLYASKEDVTLIFTGEPYSDNGEVRLSKTTGVDFEGWNLVGNPFSDTAYIERPFYIMNSSGSEIIAAADVEQNSIAPMEGVFVIATEDGETLTFTTEAPSKSGKGLALNLSQGRGVIDRAIVRFGEGQQLPKFQLRESSTKVYIPQDNKDYAVVNVGRDAMHCVSTEIPVHFKARENGVYTLTVSETFSSQLSAFSYLHLIDNLTGNDVDLLETQSYTFEAKVTDYASRFKLVFATGTEGNDDFAFIDADGNIVINGDGIVQIIDMLGHVLATRDVHSDSCLLSSDFLSSGVYVLRLMNGDQVKTQKIVIK